ncbi:hypothetical protein [Maritimibacter sp. UBA3975]|uniref:hypothetical protein n=1 Tax=Maritimibacter sp. UBA3975 TaxID=1946833 RepID=UPI000C0B9DCB|nr:hypothetical protein [Maritimibacter sp. UBA3975]MAM60117.1 hypothetical protein [Maritimibacter sp.]|tara:strand:+ start:3894 stop:4169 length:276 start_codon:yes stop_codon:yes gene_type:complete
MTPEEIDPVGLIAESYRIEGITPEECRSIFLDWVIGQRSRRIGAEEIGVMLETHADAHPDHPMTQVLKEGMTTMTNAPGRRGGAKGRRKTS